MKTIAIICDCDNTLAPDTTSMLLEDNGINLDSFWEDISNKVKLGWDPPVAWMTEIVEMIKNGNISQDTNAKLADFGKNSYHHFQELQSLLHNSTNHWEKNMML